MGRPGQTTKNSTAPSDFHPLLPLYSLIKSSGSHLDLKCFFIFRFFEACLQINCFMKELSSWISSYWVSRELWYNELCSLRIKTWCDIDTTSNLYNLVYKFGMMYQNFNFSVISKAFYLSQYAFSLDIKSTRSLQKVWKIQGAVCSIYTSIYTSTKPRNL